MPALTVALRAAPATLLATHFIRLALKQCTNSRDFRPQQSALLQQWIVLDANATNLQTRPPTEYEKYFMFGHLPNRLLNETVFPRRLALVALQMVNRRCCHLRGDDFAALEHEHHHDLPDCRGRPSG